MPTAAQGSSASAKRSATPSSAFMPPTQRIEPPKFNRDADEELLAAAAAAQKKYESALSHSGITSSNASSFSSSSSKTVASLFPHASATFVQVNEQRAAASQWRANAVARKDHEAQQLERYLHCFVPTGVRHPGAIAREQRRAQAAAITSLAGRATPGLNDGGNNSGSCTNSNNNNNNNNISNVLRPNSGTPSSLPPTSEQQKEKFQHDIASFEEKLSKLRREQRRREEDTNKYLGTSPTSDAANINNNNKHHYDFNKRSPHQQQQPASLSTSKMPKTASTSDCAPFALPKVLQMLFRLLLSRSLSATAALRAVGFPELRARLSAAAEGGMVKRHSFEAIFLECLRTDRERLEHAAVVDCFLLDAGGDAELAFVLIALQVLLGIASAADVMRYCFYLLDTSSRVPRYLTRLELEALLREAQAAAAANPASKDDTEYISMRSAVLTILDTSSDLFDGKGRMPLSTFLDKLRAAMNDASQEQSTLSLAAAASGLQETTTTSVVSPASSGVSATINGSSGVGKVTSSLTRMRKKQVQQAQQLDGLASRHDLFHHSTSRRIVLQTAPDELVKDG